MKGIPFSFILSICFLFIAGVQLSCSLSNEIVGTWKADKYTTWEKGIAYLKGCRGILKGKEIIFNPDFTFTQTFNGKISTGNWHVIDDSLYLDINDSNIQHKDSIDATNNLFQLKKSNAAFAIKENKLVKYYPGNYCRRRKSDGSIRFRDNFGIEILKRNSSQAPLNKKQLSEKHYSEDFIHGEKSKLHYLDWHGSGEPLILIHGLGDTPYLFEDIANSLKKDYRIIAYSRRGHYKSVAYDSNYDNSTLVSDLKLLLDSLEIPKANLLGFSMAGNEITEFAIRYPERTNRLIYLEAGYDLSEEPFTALLDALPESIFADTSDLSSIESYRKWYHRFWFPDIDWNETLEKNLLASVQVNVDKSVSPLPYEEISRTTMKEAMNYHRNYDKVLAPALVFYTREFFLAPEDDTTLVAMYEKMEREIIDPWRQYSIQRMEEELRHSTIKTLSKGSHASLIFLSKNEIIRSIHEFLSKE